jgi:hypothetical protein
MLEKLGKSLSTPDESKRYGYQKGAHIAYSIDVRKKK